MKHEHMDTGCVQHLQVDPELLSEFAPSGDVVVDLVDNLNPGLQVADVCQIVVDGRRVKEAIADFVRSALHSIGAVLAGKPEGTKAEHVEPVELRGREILEGQRAV
mmetsp:Transcript_64805/g.95777  ORF Transcript_64805/g.95777 Transcript_64805/m.95777 type:complete len:106 (+) Transcript_64805:167-484(+)